MKNMHSHSRNGALNQLSVFIGSWNMGKLFQEVQEPYF